MVVIYINILLILATFAEFLIISGAILSRSIRFTLLEPQWLTIQVNSDKSNLVGGQRKFDLYINTTYQSYIERYCKNQDQRKVRLIHNFDLSEFNLSYLSKALFY